MLVNSYIAAAVLAFCAAQTGAAPVAVPPPELLAEKNIVFQGFDPSTWTPAKRDAEAQWNTANKDGSVPDSFMQAVNKWQKAKNSGSSSSKSKDDKRDALSIVVGPDGYIPPQVQEQLDRWDGRPAEEKRDALSVAVDPKTGRTSPKAQEQLDRWNEYFGQSTNSKRDAADEKKQNLPQGPGVLDLKNGEYRPLMIQRREAAADPQVFSGLPSANWFKQYKAAQSKKNKKNNGKREAEAEAEAGSGKSSYISIPANAWAAALKKQKGGE